MQIAWRAATNVLLQLGALSQARLLLQLLWRLQRLRRAQYRGRARVDFGEAVALVHQETVHVADVHEIFFVLARDANRLPPLVNHLENSRHYGPWVHRRSFWESAHQLVQKLFGRNLQMHQKAAVLYKDVEQIERKDAHMRHTSVDALHNLKRSFACRVGPLRVNVVGQLQRQRQVQLLHRRVAAPINVRLNLRRTPRRQAIFGCVPRRGRCDSP